MNVGVNTPATKYSPRDNKRPQLLDAAACHFAEAGYDAASMREIAAAAGMKAGSMYYYFPDACIFHNHTLSTLVSIYMCTLFLNHV